VSLVQLVEIQQAFVTKFSVATFEHPTSMPIQPNLALIVLFLAAYVK